MAAESFFEKVQRRLLNDSIRRVLNLDLRDLGRQVQRNMPEDTNQCPVILTSSIRLSGISLNAAFAALTAWSLELKGVPVIHFVCTGGLHPCVLGTDRKDPPNLSPPLALLAKSNRASFQPFRDQHFSLLPNENLAKLLRNLDLEQLMEFEFQGMPPLGKLVLPSIRWILRRHTLKEDEETLTLYRNYIQSAWSLALQFEILILESQPPSRSSSSTVCNIPKRPLDGLPETRHTRHFA